jgi:hypothetical protein
MSFPTRLAVVFSAATFLGACATAPAAVPASPAAVTGWYGGTMVVTSADGATPFGPPKQALVARTVDAAHDQIVEVVVDDGALRTTTLQRDGGTNVFRATDEAKSFTGTVTMTGDGWNISGWSYDLTMADGSGTIAGTATIDAAGIRTEKFFVTPNGEKKVRIVDGLSPISQAEYDAQLAGMVKQP